MTNRSRYLRALCAAARLLLLLLIVSEQVRAAAPESQRQGVTNGAVPRWVARIPLESVPAAPVEWQGAGYVLFDQQIHCSEHTIERYLHVIRRVRNAAELNAASQLNVTYDDSYQRLRIHDVALVRGGDRVSVFDPHAVRTVQRETNLERQVFDNRYTAVLFVPDVRVGDLVDYEYTLTDNDPTLGTHCTANLVWALPEAIGAVQVRLLAPKRAPIKHKTVETPSIKFSTTDIGEETEYVWRVRTKEFPAELDVPPWFDQWPTIHVSDFRSWAEVADWVRPWFEVPITAEVRKQAEQLRNLAVSIPEFVVLASRFVQDEVRYVGMELGLHRCQPNPPELTLKRRFGDCKDKSVLLIALLRSAGVTAVPVLVSVSHGKTLHAQLPSTTLFDHVIVQVGPIDGVTYYIDPTLQSIGGGLEANAVSPFWYGLVVEPGTTDLKSLKVPTPADARVSVKEKYDIPPPSSTKPATLDVEYEYQGLVANAVRATLLRMSSTDTSKYYLSKYSQRFPEIREVTPIEHSDSRNANLLTVRARYSIAKFWTVPESKGPYVGRLNLPYMAALFSQRATEQRRVPLALVHPVLAQHAISVHLPFHINLEQKDVKLAGPGFDFERSAHVSNQDVSYRYVMGSNTDTLEPARFAEYRSNVKRALDAMDRSFLYRSDLANAKGPNFTAWWAAAVVAIVSGLACWRLYKYSPGFAQVRAEGAPVLGPFSAASLLLGFQAIVAPIAFAFRIAKSRWVFDKTRWITLAGSTEHRQVLLAYTALMEVLCNVFLAEYALVVLFLFFGRKSGYRGHYCVHVALYNLVFLSSALAAGQLSPLAPHPAWFVIIVAVVTSVLWITYVLRSRRVARTFALD